MDIWCQRCLHAPCFDFRECWWQMGKPVETEIKWLDILLTTILNSFSWMEMFEFQIKLHWNVFLGLWLTICLHWLTHWGRVTHVCVSKLSILDSDNGLSPGRRQAIIWTNAGILLIWTLGTNFSEIISEIHAYSFKKMHLKMSSAKWRPFCLGLNVLRQWLDTEQATSQYQNQWWPRSSKHKPLTWASFF